MHSRYKIWLSGLMLVTIMFIIVPGELLHCLIDHSDTKDIYNPNGRVSIEIKHHHCEILKFQIREFTTQLVFDIQLIHIPVANSSFHYSPPDLQISFLKVEQRGPPVPLV